MNNSSTTNVNELGSAALRKLASSLKIANYSRIQKPNLVLLVEQAQLAQQNMKKETTAPDPILEVETTPETIPTPEVEETVPSEQTPAEVVTEGDPTAVDQVVAEVVKASRSKTIQVEVTAEMTAIITSTEIVKSEKFRKLHELGMLIPQIAKVTESHYSFVHGVIDRKKTLIA